MNYKKFILPAFIALLSFIAINCGYDKPDYGPEINASQMDKGQNTGKIGDTVYIKMTPEWSGFNHPMDIIIGPKDNFVYVADTDNDRIVMMDLSGNVIGSRSVKHPIALAQDFQFNLLVCARMDSVIQGKTETVSAVYKIDLFAAGHNIAAAPVTRLLPTKNDFRFINEVKRREYTGVCVFYDNSFYVSRKGPENTRLDDPDNSILIFQKILSGGVKKDTLIGPVPMITPEGTGLLSANKISSLTSFSRNNFDFVVTLIGENSFKTQWLQFVSTSSYTGYASKLQPGNVRMMDVNRFRQPEDAAVDYSGNIFVADAAKDSIFKFSPYGEELQSFGGPSVFKHPSAVTVFNKVVYVADTDNNRILRFQLSTDL